MKYHSKVKTPATLVASCLALVTLCEVHAASSYPWQPQGYGGSVTGYADSYETLLGGGTLLLQGSVSTASRLPSGDIQMSSAAQDLGTLTLNPASEPSLNYIPSRLAKATAPAAPIGSDVTGPAGGSALTSTITTSSTAIESVVFNGFAGQSASTSAVSLSYGDEADASHPLSITAVPEPASIFGGMALLGLIAFREISKRRRVALMAIPLNGSGNA